MHLDQQRDIVRQLLADAANGTTQRAADSFVLRVEEFVSPEVWAREQLAWFRDRPVMACLSGDLAEPGAYVAFESGGVPLVVVRHGDGSVRAFVNVCRHRGSPLVDDGHGSLARTFHCGFHGWTYDLDGALVNQPHADAAFVGLDDSCTSLVRRAADEAHGLVWVHPTSDTAFAAADFVDGLGPELDSFAFGSYHRFDQWASTWHANWKLLAATFLETYHVPALHPRTVARNFLVQPSAYATFGPNIRFHSLMKSLLSLADQPEETWSLLPHGTVEYVLAPNTILNYSVDHLALYQLWPRAADRTDVVLTLYTAEPADDSTAEHFQRTLALHQRVSGGEDFTKQVAVHRALASGAMPTVVFGRNEGAAIAFLQTIGSWRDGAPDDERHTT